MKISKKAKLSRPHNMKKTLARSTSKKANRRSKKTSVKTPIPRSGKRQDIPAPKLPLLKTHQLGSGTMPKIKHELKVKELKEIQRERGVKTDVFLNVPGGDGGGSHSRKVPERERAAIGPYPTILICGLGFAGLAAARSLRRGLGKEGRIIGIDTNERFVFIPALMAMAGGFFTHNEISAPFKDCLAPLDVEYIHDTILKIDPAKRIVRTKTASIAYDYCIVALGASSNPLPIGFDDKTLSLRDSHDADGIWQAAEAASAEKAKRFPNKPFDVSFGIVGGGPTGVQLASWFKDGLQRHLDKTVGGRGKAIITLFQHGPELVPGLPKKARRKTAELLIKQGINVHLNTAVKGSTDNIIALEDGNTFKMDRVVFCGGWRQSPVLESMGLPFDPRCGIKAWATLQSVDDPYIFAAGDALCFEPNGLNINGWKRAQNAKLIARTLADNIIAHSRGEALEEFKIRDTPVILDLRPVSILIKDGKTHSSRIFWYAAQGIRLLNMYVVRHPTVPLLS